MRSLRFAAAFVVLSAGLLAQAPGTAPPKTHLKVGDAAPDFTLPSTAGQPVTLSSFKGKNPVVLAFFPVAFTGG
jgi:cytochrome oxidase Cu insertion factor (SCO1/SenC/PrrC family)